MPVMDGFEATQQLLDQMKNEELRWIPIIGCSAFVDPEIKQKGLDLGMKNFLTKPINIKALKETLKTLK